jgi:RNA polymerase sigma factor (sigma-70 family)
MEFDMSQSTGSKEEDVFSLVLKAKEGNIEALEKLLEHPVVKSRASTICQRILWRSPKAGYYRDAEDLKQDLLISFWENLDNFRCEHGEGSFWKFFEIIARNIHMSQVRKITREMAQSDDKAFDELSVVFPQNQHSSLAIKLVIESLDDREKYILEHRLAGEGLVEIADNAPFEIAKSTVHRVLEGIQRKLVACVEGCEDPDISKQAGTKKSGPSS